MDNISNYFCQHDWLIFNQPFQSLVKNVKDACIFLIWSKAVSSEKALNIVSEILSGERIYQKIQKLLWEDNFIPSISCAYAEHQ